VPCGRCIGCRLEYSRQWATRCYLESTLHLRNCFITLTYSDEHLPEDGSLDKSHLQKFFKRLRKQKGKFRYFACGEYGEKTLRAHYHACLFGMDFEDKIEFQKNGEHTLYVSQQLNQLWGYGHTSIGALTFETAAYTARYVLKKKLGKGTLPYARLDEETGELIPVVQPYAVMSLRSAIAAQWLPQFHGDIYGHEKDFLVLRGKKMRPPKYFDKLFDKINPLRMEKIKEKRKEEHEPLSIEELRAHEKKTRARIIQRKKI